MHPQFIYTIHRLQAPSHPDLEDALSKPPILDIT